MLIERNPFMKKADQNMSFNSLLEQGLKQSHFNQANQSNESRQIELTNPFVSNSNNQNSTSVLSAPNNASLSNAFNSNMFDSSKNNVFLKSGLNPLIPGTNNENKNVSKQKTEMTNDFKSSLFDNLKPIQKSQNQENQGSKSGLFDMFANKGNSQLFTNMNKTENPMFPQNNLISPTKISETKSEVGLKEGDPNKKTFSNLDEMKKRLLEKKHLSQKAKAQKESGFGDTKGKSIFGNNTNVSSIFGKDNSLKSNFGTESKNDGLFKASDGGKKLEEGEVDLEKKKKEEEEKEQKKKEEEEKKRKEQEEAERKQKEEEDRRRREEEEKKRRINRRNTLIKNFINKKTNRIKNAKTKRLRKWKQKNTELKIRISRLTKSAIAMNKKNKRNIVLKNLKQYKANKNKVNQKFFLINSTSLMV